MRKVGRTAEARSAVGTTEGGAMKFEVGQSLEEDGIADGTDSAPGGFVREIATTA